MSTQLDINLLPLVRLAGKEQPGLPGFFAVTPPRKSARGRSEDHLILLLSCSGGSPYPANLQEQWFSRVSEAYYRTPGSTTAAMRAAADALNLILFERTLRGAGTRLGLGLFTLLVMRGEQIFIGQCGPQHTFMLTADRLDHYFDPDNTGNGLGVARTVTIRYFQSALHSNEYVLVTHQLPDGWSESTLQGVYGQGLESLRRRLLNAAGPDLGAVLIQIQAGHGHMRLLKLKATPPTAEPPKPGKSETVAPRAPETFKPSIPTPDEILVTPPPSAPAPSDEQPQTPAMLAPASDATGTATPTTVPPAATIPAYTPSPQETAAKPSLFPGVTAPPGTKTTAAPTQTRPTPSASARRIHDRTPSKPAKPRKSIAAALSNPFRKLSQFTGRALGKTGRGLARGLRAIAKRILPDEGMFHLPASTMIFFAIAIPVVIAIIGGMMYLERGRNLQYQSYYDQAFDLALKADTLQDPAQQRAAWGLVLLDLNTAETFRATEDSNALRIKAQQALDQIEQVYRINLQPAIRGDLDQSVQISRMVATTDELYMVNAARGNVMRALNTSMGYEVDPNFRCGKGNYGTVVVGAPIGLVALPKGNTNNADILGLDENGNRLYCGTDSDLPMAKRVTLPTLWQKPSAITLNPDNLNLYVLDKPANQVWIYQNVEKTTELLPFFDEDQPPNLADVIDIAAASGDLFLLRKDGSLSRCTYGLLKETLTRCNPITFTSLPGGRPDNNNIEGTQFWQLVYAPPPGPSLYLLDAANQAVLHFSLLGNFQNQYRSANPLPAEPAIALAINPKRSAFIAVGNQVYYTNLP